MIKYYYVLTSLFVIYFVASAQWETHESAHVQEVSLAKIQVKERINPTSLYEFEKHWITAAEELSKPKSPVIAPKIEKDKPTGHLTIGATSYTLLGVFDEQGSKFIVLKNDKNTLVRVSEGAAISAEAILMLVQADKIEVKVGNEITVHKLFKRTQSETNE